MLQHQWMGKLLLKFKLGQKLKAVLDEDTFRDHFARLSLQVPSLHLLLATSAPYVICSRDVLSADPIVGRLLEHTPTSVTACAQCSAKDEETAWTIVASQAASSQAFSLARSETQWSGRDSFISDKSFAFTNDLLTGPVYDD